MTDHSCFPPSGRPRRSGRAPLHAAQHEVGDYAFATEPSTSLWEKRWWSPPLRRNQKL